MKPVPIDRDACPASSTASRSAIGVPGTPHDVLVRDREPHGLGARRQHAAAIGELPAVGELDRVRVGVEPGGVPVDDLDAVDRVERQRRPRPISPRRNSLVSGGRLYGGRSSSVRRTTSSAPPASR